MHSIACDLYKDPLAQPHNFALNLTCSGPSFDFYEDTHQSSVHNSCPFIEDRLINIRTLASFSTMLAFHRQVVYWTTSLLAVVTYNLRGSSFSALDFGRSITADATVFLLVACTYWRDLHLRAFPPRPIDAKTPPEAPSKTHALAWFLFESICLIGVGYGADFCQSVWYADREGYLKRATTNFIHTTLAYIMLSELEYLRTKVCRTYAALSRRVR